MKLADTIRSGWRKLVSACPFTDKGLRSDNDRLTTLLKQVLDERDGLLHSLGEIHSAYVGLNDSFVLYLAGFAMQASGEANLSKGILEAVRKGGAGVHLSQAEDGSVVFTLTKPEEGESE